LESGPFLSLVVFAVVSLENGRRLAVPPIRTQSLTQKGLVPRFVS